MTQSWKSLTRERFIPSASFWNQSSQPCNVWIFWLSLANLSQVKGSFRLHLFGVKAHSSHVMFGDSESEKEIISQLLIDLNTVVAIMWNIDNVTKVLKIIYWQIPQYSIELHLMYFYRFIIPAEVWQMHKNQRNKSLNISTCQTLQNESWRFQNNGLLQSWGSETAGRNRSCQMASCHRGLPLPHRVRHVRLRHRHLGRWLRGGEQALGPLGLRPHHNDHLCVAHASWPWQVCYYELYAYLKINSVIFHILQNLIFCHF